MRVLQMNNDMNFASEALTIRQVATFAIVTILAAVLAGQLRVEFGAEYEHATLKQLMDGAAVTPFQFRMLAPAVLGLIYHSFSVELLHLVRWYETACFLLTVWGIFLFGRATGLSPAQAAMTGLSYLFMIPFLFIFQTLSRLYFPYDSASVIFWAVSLWALATGRKWTFLWVFAAGTLNRESIVLVFVLGVLFNWRKSTLKERSVFIATGVLIFVAVRLFLYQQYGSNAGAGFISFDHDIMHKGLPTSLESSRYYTNFMLLKSLESLAQVASAFGFLWILAFVCRNRIPHPFLKMSVYLIPVSFLIMFFVGNIDESRIFCELAPIVLVSMAHICRSLPSGFEIARLS
jgi:hypothetical protein